jgi:hypothetical protein
MEYLGYIVSVGKFSVSTKTVEAVADWLVSTSLKEEKRILPSLKTVKRSKVLLKYY